ncbi:hypothetical protein E2C01_005395 [Portunus trituberculatus]|uniref:Uncharacterized protein n=1 Tax=Portunus trituberculatus TaxID=210409 RepID=A0A5B7CTE3_PORTR|nr:hypothetical protein [Portunus trituberculatus]
MFYHDFLLAFQVVACECLESREEGGWEGGMRLEWAWHTLQHRTLEQDRRDMMDTETQADMNHTKPSLNTWIGWRRSWQLEVQDTSLDSHS